jgi:Protein of unknown function (DUF3500)
MTPARDIGDAVRAWLDTLDERQRERASFPFDTDERFVWAYTPGQREGLAIRDMRPGQRSAAMAIVEASMSQRTAREIAAIMALETVLGEIEQTAGRAGWLRRDPELYWFAVFGEPGAGAWSWRVGGHHVAVQVTLDGQTVLGATPSFLGANPAVVPGGPAAGMRTLTGEELLARELHVALTPAERLRAVIDDRAPADILTGIGRRADLHNVPAGVRHANLGAARAALFERLIRHYVERLRPDLAGPAWDRLASELGDVTFAWAGSDAPGRGHYYAIRGPSLVIEYDNTQNGANHIHSVWRDLENDWGGDVLGAHLAAHHVGPGSS